MRDIFTRDQQAEAFRKAYTTVDVFTTTLRNLGNFKSILTSVGVINRIPKITSARAFQLRRDGSHQVLVGMKEYMHHDNYTGITADGVFTGEHHPLFVAGIPRVEDAEPFKLNTIDDDTIAKVEQRYKSVFPTVDALYPCESDSYATVLPTKPRNKHSTPSRIAQHLFLVKMVGTIHDGPPFFGLMENMYLP